jgi:hypothetical protein
MADPAVAAANAYMSTLSFELAAQAITAATSPLLTPAIKAVWVGKLQERPDPEQLFAEAQERMQALQPPQVDRRFVYGWDTVGGHQAQLAQRIKDTEDGKVSPFL